MDWRLNEDTYPALPNPCTEDCILVSVFRFKLFTVDCRLNEDIYPALPNP